jgi:hypothetical protein
VSIRIPEPLDVDWTMKGLDTAQTTFSLLEDGRLCLGIKHELLAGVSPTMIVWYLNHMTDLYEWKGQQIQRYRMWHPRDHISLGYLKPGNDGRNFSQGALIRIQEAFGGDSAYYVDSKSKVQYLDETGMCHISLFHGLEAAKMEYKFTETAQGTLYENSMIVGLEGGGALARMFNRIIRPRVFPDHKGRAWLKHNVEEVGNFQFFLPSMYQAEASN